MKKFIPYGKHFIDEDDIQNVVDVLRSKNIAQGETTPLFENEVKKFVNVKYALAVNSATSALHLACLALGLKKNDIVWSSPTTFVSSLNCARFCGAKVDFVDIDPSTGLMNIDLLEKKLFLASKNNLLPKILIPVHLAGTSCDMRRIKELSEEYNFSIIEDASHAIGGSYENYKVGSCKYSDITVFSFHPVKIITTGEGGMATTNQKMLAERMRDLSTHGIIKDSSRFISKSSCPWFYEQQYLGFNYRITDIQSSLGLSQLSKLSRFVKKRNEIFYIYSDLLRDQPISILEIPKNVYSALHLMIIRLNNSDEEFHRSVFKELRNHDIGVQLHYLPVHLQPYYKNLGFKVGDFPNAEFYAKNAISLPIYPALKLEEINYIVEVLKNLLRI